MNSSDRDDSADQELELKRFQWDGTSPLERAKDPEGWRQRRLKSLKEVIKGPSSPEDWLRAKEEYGDLRRGYSYDDEEEFGW